MSIRNQMLTVTAGALLTFVCAGVFAADPKILFTHASRGTVVSIDAGKLVVSHQKSGKPETLDFVVTPGTSRKGNPAAGDIVSVHYRIENHQRVATSIQAERAKKTH